jgi:hypothetical protein
MNAPFGGVLLLSPEFVETSSRAEQLVDRTVLDHSSVVEEENPVGVSDARQPMGDDHPGARSRIRGERIDHGGLVLASNPLTLTELNDYLDQRGVARHARPDLLTAMTALPTTPVGRVDKKAIARQLQR